MFVGGATTVATGASPYWNPDLPNNINLNAVYLGVMPNPVPSSDLGGKQNAP